MLKDFLEAFWRLLQKPLLKKGFNLHSLFPCYGESDVCNLETRFLHRKVRPPFLIAASASATAATSVGPTPAPRSASLIPPLQYDVTYCRWESWGRSWAWWACVRDLLHDLQPDGPAPRWVSRPTWSLLSATWLDNQPFPMLMLLIYAPLIRMDFFL